MAYANEISKTHATLFSAVASEYLLFCGLDLVGTEWQSDNGPEFWDTQALSGLPSSPYP